MEIIVGKPSDGELLEEVLQALKDPVLCAALADRFSQMSRDLVGLEYFMVEVAKAIPNADVMIATKTVGDLAEYVVNRMRLGEMETGVVH